jgi:hypothetical protein
MCLTVTAMHSYNSDTTANIIWHIQVNILVPKISIQVARTLFQQEEKSRSRSLPWKYRATYGNVPDSYTYGLLVMITVI